MKLNTQHGVTRREFLACSALTSAAVLTGCAIDPVTGQQQFMIVSPEQELAIDRQNAAFQFSGEYGPSQSILSRVMPSG